MHREIRACPACRFLSSNLTRLVLVVAVTALLSSCKKEPDAAVNSPPPAGSGKLDTPKKVGIAFAKAAEADDMDTVHKLAIGTDQEFSLAKGFGQMIHSVREYEATAIQKFGDDGKLSRDTTLVDMAAAFEAAAEKITGDTATLDVKGSPVQLKKDGDSWKVNLDFLDNTPASLDESKALPAKALVVDEIRKGIESEKFLRGAKAWEALQDKLREITGPTKPDKVKAEIHDIETALGLYKANIGDYPAKLEFLVTNPGNTIDWKGPYLRELPKDPWGHPYHYKIPATHNLDGVDVWSDGDGKSPADKLNNWSTAN
jgi:type II secretion system protein G